MEIISKELILPNWNLIEHCIFSLLKNQFDFTTAACSAITHEEYPHLGNHSEIFELTKATTISLKTERTKPILDAGNHQRAIENHFTTTRNSKNHWNHPKAVQMMKFHLYRCLKKLLEKYFKKSTIYSILSIVSLYPYFD
jgi:hypothetical protein